MKKTSILVAAICLASLIYAVDLFRGKGQRLFDQAAPKIQLAIWSLSPRGPWAASNSFNITLNSGASFTTNPNFNATIQAPASATKMRWGLRSNLSAESWGPMIPSFSYSYIFTNSTNRLWVWVELKNDLEETALVGTSIMFIPWRNFALTIDDGAGFATNRYCSLNLNLNNSVTGIRLANDSNFSVSDTGWISPVSATNWFLKNDLGIKTVLLLVTNSVYGLSYPILVDTIFAHPITNTAIFLANGISSSANASQGLRLYASYANQMRVSSNFDFTSGIPWVNFTNFLDWTLAGDGNYSTNILFTQFSNSHWGAPAITITNRFIYNTNDRVSNTIGIVLLAIPGGTYNQGQNGLATPIQSTTVSPFLMSRYETRWIDWTNVWNWATTNGYSFESSGMSGYRTGFPPTGSQMDPVVYITWSDIVKWCNALSEKEGRIPSYYLNSGKTIIYRTGTSNLTTNMVNWWGNGYRLPTEAEWEYACRAGSTNDFWWGSTYKAAYSRSDFSGVAWNYEDDYNNWETTRIVGLLSPNAFGLYDMAGNASEVCWDHHRPYPGIPQTDPYGDDSGDYRVCRGGAIKGHHSYLTSATRGSCLPSSKGEFRGFRIVLSSQ